MDPPENLRVSDPGYLGLLRISWSPPASLSRSSDCRSSYQLEYFDCSSNSWVVSCQSGDIELIDTTQTVGTGTVVAQQRRTVDSLY